MACAELIAPSNSLRYGAESCYLQRLDTLLHQLLPSRFFQATTERRSGSKAVAEMVQDINEKELAHANGNTPANGAPLNGHPRGPDVDEEEDEQTDENIFVFVPNLIGEWRDWTREVPTAC